MMMRGVLSMAVLVASAVPLAAQSNMNAQEKANVQFVLDWWREVIQSRHVELAPKYQAEDYIQHNINIETGRAAFQKVFGSDPSGLERELRNYVRSYTFHYTRAAIQPEANLAMEVRPMAWPDVLFRLGDLLANVDDEHRAAAEEHFRAALAARPDYGPALGGLGYLAANRRGIRGRGSP